VATAMYRETEAHGDSTKQPPKSIIDNLEKVFGFNPPRKHGFDTVIVLKAMHSGKARVFFCHGR